MPSLDHLPEESKTYTDYVRTLCSRNPSLFALHSFLSNPKARANGCHAAALDFWHGEPLPKSRHIQDIDSLQVEWKRTDNLPGHLQGRILIIEDLTAPVVELLGSLDIDPLFLALHLHTVQRSSMHHQTPDEATLPSRLQEQNYINIVYHHPVTCNNGNVGRRLIGDTAIDRKLLFLRSTNIGLAQHCVSIIRFPSKDDFWLGR